MMIQGMIFSLVSLYPRILPPCVCENIFIEPAPAYVTSFLKSVSIQVPHSNRPLPDDSVPFPALSVTAFMAFSQASLST
jgi:hypothetical protein